MHNGAFFLHNSECILLASQIKPTISSRETCAAGSVKRQLTRGLLENCLFRWAAHPFQAGYSDVSSLDLNLHKHAEPRARRKAVTSCTGLLREGKKKISLQGATAKLSATAELQTPEGFQPRDMRMRIRWSSWLRIHMCHECWASLRIPTTELVAKSNSLCCYGDSMTTGKTHKTGAELLQHFPHTYIFQKSQSPWQPEHNYTNKSIGEVPHKPSIGCSKYTVVAAKWSFILTVITAVRI